MKLLQCQLCGDVFMLMPHVRTCSCGASLGKYCPDGFRARYIGPAIPILICNISLRKAADKQPFAKPSDMDPEENYGPEFKAWVGPFKDENFQREAHSPDYTNPETFEEMQAATRKLHEKQEKKSEDIEQEYRKSKDEDKPFKISVKHLLKDYGF